MALKIKAIIFDLGNVLLNFDHMIAAKRISGFTDKGAEEIYQMFFDSPVTRLFEEGKITPADFFKQVKHKLALNIGFEVFLPIWNEIFFLSENNLLVCNLAKDLSLHYKLAILSNINALHMGYIKDNFPVFCAFKNFFASCELGMVKPDPLIYKKAMELLGVSPEEVFYTDDRKELVAEASKMGIKANVYTDPLQLENDLISCGIRAVKNPLPII